MTRYLDSQGNKRDVLLVKDMQKKKTQQVRDKEQAIIDHNAPQRVEWELFLRQATAHLPKKDVRFFYTNASLTRCRLYSPNDLFDMGELFMEESLNDDGTVHERSYHVTSHHIANRRFCSYNSPWEYRTRTSKSLDKAVKNARTAIRPNSLADVGRVTLEDMKHYVYDLRSRARTEFQSATGKLGFSPFHIESPLPTVLDDIVRQTDMGLIRMSDESNDLLSKFHKARDRSLDVDNTQYARLCWVHMNHAGDQVVETHRVRVGAGSLQEDADKGLTSYEKDFCMRNKATYCNNVPEDVQHKVSVLSMLDDREYVEEVGYKFADSVYYIFEEER